MSYSSLRRGRVVVLLAIGITGCGLSDYQGRLDQQSARVREFDELNKLLDDPIDAPPRIEFEAINPETKEKEKTDKQGWPFEIFVRLPKGHGTTPREKTPFGYPFPLFRYSGGTEGAMSIFVAADWIADPKGDEPEKGMLPAVFRAWLMRGLQDYCGKANKIALAVPDKVEPKPIDDVKAVDPYPKAKLSYKYFELTDKGHPQVKEASVFEVYIREEINKQVAIVFHRPIQPLNAAALNKSLRACLGSLDVGNNAGPRRVLFRKAKGG